MEITTKLVSKKLLTPTFISLWIIMFLVEFVKGALIVSILPVYMGDVLHLSAFAIGLSFSLQYIGDNVFRSPAGWFIERVGFRLTMMLGLLLTFVAVLIIAMADKMGMIVLGCALIGIGTAPLWPCVLMGISAVTRENNNFGTAMGVIQISSLGGTGLGPVIINFFVDGSYRPVFWVLLALMGIVVIVSLFLPGKSKMKSSPGTAGQPSEEPSLWEGGVKGVLNNVRQSIRHIKENLHVSRLLFPALFLQTFAIGLLTPVITLYVRTELDLSPEAFSALLVTGGGITVIGLIPIGRLVDRFGTKWFLHIGFALSSVAIGLFAVTRSISLVWILVILIGISYACILPTWDTMISHMLPEGEKGTVWGLFLTVQGSGMVVGPIISGKMWDMLGPSAPFMASAIVMGILFFVHIIISRQKSSLPRA
ncbi:MFS transporter [Paenibacillus sp. FSL W8-0186]|uniref:Multidrug resistance protein MdtG n=1 Tax=Paenibacillus woosongensis TaxID=307580 RepID=A0ABQ4MPW2_9BACL|nr:MFS transporter [Paenibacillus woosongensis]GIP57939.1 multidrug resistance protein MdtG [Paenibacillus woosongensis]